MSVKEKLWKPPDIKALTKQDEEFIRQTLKEDIVPNGLERVFRTAMAVRRSISVNLGYVMQTGIEDIPIIWQRVQSQEEISGSTGLDQRFHQAVVSYLQAIRAKSDGGLPTIEEDLILISTISFHIMEVRLGEREMKGEHTISISDMLTLVRTSENEAAKIWQIVNNHIPLFTPADFVSTSDSVDNPQA